MVVAVILVRPVKAAVDQVVDVVVVGHRVVAAVIAVCVRWIAGNGGGVAARMRLIDRDHMLVDVIVVRMMQMAIVYVIDVVVVADRGVATLWSVLMGVAAFVNIVGAHTPTLRRCLGRRKDAPGQSSNSVAGIR